MPKKPFFVHKIPEKEVLIPQKVLLSPKKPKIKLGSKQAGNFNQNLWTIFMLQTWKNFYFTQNHKYFPRVNHILYS